MLRIFKNFRKQEVVLALFSVVFVVAQVWLELKLPDYMREITSLITTQDSAMHDILIAGGKMLLCAFGSLLVTVLVAVCASRIASNFSAIVRGKLFACGAYYNATVFFNGRDRTVFNSESDHAFYKRCDSGADVDCNGAVHHVAGTNHGGDGYLEDC